MSYVEPSVRVLSRLREVFKTGPFKEFYDGDPDRIPSNCLPAICVVQTNDTNSVSDNQSDQVDCEVQIRVVFNKKDDFGLRALGPPKRLTDEKIRNVVEARDPETGRYLPHTVKGALRTGFQLDPSSFMRRNMRFELGSVLRTDGQQDILTREGVLTITIVYPVDIADMS